jgi:AraC family transcriptional regulator, regulatory protein of adaptative response / DNA-3-methyladenine glycosylase II
VGSRHLRRLFVRHLGATPIAVAQTRRLHFAKSLIDETKLPMHEIAIAAGFGCVRRFNAAIRTTYKRTPTQIRRLSRQPGSLPEHEYVFRLRYRPPYDWNGILDFLRPRATPGVEEVSHGAYRRLISFRGEAGYFEVSHEQSANSLAVRVQFADPRALYFIIERIRAMFDLNADWTTIARALASDPALAQSLKTSPGLRVPGCWDGFEMGVRAILGQQITVAGATTLAGRLARQFGKLVPAANGLTHVFPGAEILADAEIAGIGLPRARAETIRAFARAVLDQRISFEGSLDGQEFLRRLRSIPGIGVWTAQYIAMRTLGDPDAFPSGDLGLLRKLRLRSSSELERRAELWRPWRAYATMYLWTRPPQPRAKKPRSSERKKSVIVSLGQPEKSAIALRA